MPYDWEGNEIESKADRHTNMLGIGEIGGVGQLIYNAVRFEDYKYYDSNWDKLLVQPICNEKSPPEVDPEGDLSGRAILTSLCDLAKRIDDDHEKGFDELILDWCKTHMHPYGVDALYRAVTDEGFDIGSFDAEMVERDGIFSLHDFMKELGNLYNAVRFYIALNAVAVGDDDAAFEMEHEGRHFETLPFLERYKHPEPERPDIDYSSANGDLVAEMQLDRAYFEAHPEEGTTGHYREPYDDFDELRENLINCIPDFRLRVKLDSKTGKIAFAADVSSVFDIAWYTFARLLTEEPSLEQLGSDERCRDGILICCHHCGRFFVRNFRQQKYCDRPECQKARNSKNQREFRKRKAIEKARAEKKQPKTGE